MACYPCTHCNKCGMYYSVPTAMVCAECGTVVPLGTLGCPKCGCRKVKAVAVADLPAENAASPSADEANTAPEPVEAAPSGDGCETANDAR